MHNRRDVRLCTNKRIRQSMHALFAKTWITSIAISREQFRIYNGCFPLFSVTRTLPCPQFAELTTFTTTEHSFQMVYCILRYISYYDHNAARFAMWDTFLRRTVTKY